MRKTIWAAMFAVAALAVDREARADAEVHSADVLRPGDNMIYGEVGWPDLVFGFQHGMSDKVDLGFRFAFIYGYEYRPYSVLGLSMGVPIRITALRREKISVQLRFTPGIKFDSFGHTCNVNDLDNLNDCTQLGEVSSLSFGLMLGLGVDVGIHLTRDATLTFGMEAPFFVNFTNGVYGGIPLMFGPGFEYHIDQNMALGLNLKFGPSIIAATVTDQFGNSTSVTDTDLAFITQAYFGYKL